MPDLSGLFSGTSVDGVLNRMFRGGGPKDPTAHALQVNFNRLVDGLIEDYESARRYLSIAATRSGEVPLWQFTMSIGHFENCLTTILRAIHFGQKLRKRTRRVMIPSGPSVLSPDVERTVREVRNAIEHMEEDIASGRWQKGDPYCLFPKEDRVQLGAMTIRYDELAAWVRELHALAVDTAQYMET